MRVQFLGTGDAFCSGGRFQTCFLIATSNFQFLIDCGATSLLAMHSQGLDPDQLDGVVISHFHGDHFGGLPFFLLDANFQSKRTRPLLIAGPLGIENRVGELLNLSYPGVGISDLSFEVAFKEFNTENRMVFGPLEIETYPVKHVAEALPHGIRIFHNHKCLAFSGDTGWTENLFKIADKADLFICECNFFTTNSPSHLNYQKIVAERHNLDCKRIILNHLGPEMLKNLDSLELECSFDGLTLDI